jgi:hypothetical protein
MGLYDSPFCMFGNLTLPYETASGNFRDARRQRRFVLHHAAFARHPDANAFSKV